MQINIKGKPTILYGPDGRRLGTKEQHDKDIREMLEVDEIPDNDGTDGVMTRAILRTRMQKAMHKAKIYDRFLRGGASLSSSNEYGDREIIIKNEKTGVKVEKNLAENKYKHVKDWAPDPLDEMF